MKRRSLFKWLGVIALAPLSVIPKIPNAIRKLKISWSPELTSHYSDAVEHIAEQIRKEIDEEILKEMVIRANDIHKQGSPKANFVVIRNETFKELVK